MKHLMLTTILTLGLVTWSSAELIENGDFSDGVAYWNMGPSPHYGNPDPKFELVEGALEATKLHSSKAQYLGIAQAVNIRKGKGYKLSYEVKGVGEGSYGVGIAHPGKGRHLAKNQALPGSSWTPMEFEFEGKFDTDEKWFKKVRSATKKNELVKGLRTTTSDKLKKIDKVERNDPPTRSTLRFSIGALKGSIAVRNVSIVEAQ